MRLRSKSAFFICVMLCACNSASNDPAPAPNVIEQTKDDSRAAPGTPDAIFVQTLPDPDFPTPDTTTRGSFELRDGCLNFVTGEGSFRAVIPSGSEFVGPDTVMLNDGRQIKIGQPVVIKGAEGEFGRPSNRPPTCPVKAILIGGVEK